MFLRRSVGSSAKELYSGLAPLLSHKAAKKFQQRAYVDSRKTVGRNSAGEFPGRRLRPFVSSLVVQAVIGRGPTRG